MCVWKLCFLILEKDSRVGKSGFWEAMTWKCALSLNFKSHVLCLHFWTEPFMFYCGGEGVESWYGIHGEKHMDLYEDLFWFSSGLLKTPHCHCCFEFPSWTTSANCEGFEVIQLEFKICNAIETKFLSIFGFEKFFVKSWNNEEFIL